jgi:hypothetical protein
MNRSAAAARLTTPLEQELDDNPERRDAQHRLKKGSPQPLHRDLPPMLHQHLVQPHGQHG